MLFVYLVYSLAALCVPLLPSALSIKTWLLGIALAAGEVRMSTLNPQSPQELCIFESVNAALHSPHALLGFS